MWVLVVPNLISLSTFAQAADKAKPESCLAQVKALATFAGGQQLVQSRDLSHNGKSHTYLILGPDIVTEFGTFHLDGSGSCVKSKPDNLNSYIAKWIAAYPDELAAYSKKNPRRRDGMSADGGTSADDLAVQFRKLLKQCQAESNRFKRESAIAKNKLSKIEFSGYDPGGATTPAASSKSTAN